MNTFIVSRYACSSLTHLLLLGAEVNLLGTGGRGGKTMGLGVELTGVVWP